MPCAYGVFRSFYAVIRRIFNIEQHPQARRSTLIQKMSYFESVKHEWASLGPLAYSLIIILITYVITGDFIGLGSRYQKVPGAPIVGAKFPFEPRWLTRLRFYSSGWDIIQKGCETVRNTTTSKCLHVTP